MFHVVWCLYCLVLLYFSRLLNFWYCYAFIVRMFDLIFLHLIFWMSTWAKLLICLNGCTCFIPVCLVLWWLIVCFVYICVLYFVKITFLYIYFFRFLSSFHPFIPGELFLPYKLDWSIYQFRGVWFMCFYHFYSTWRKTTHLAYANSVAHAEQPHHAVFDVGFPCLQRFLLWNTGYKWVDTPTFVAGCVSLAVATLKCLVGYSVS